MPGEQPKVPSGTVTFLFSDVVGSTRLWAADPDTMSVSLRIHDQMFNETIAKYEGHVFSTAGDSFAAAFARASAAVDCAQAIQQGLAGVDWGPWPQLTVRIGLHQGEAEERDANYFGPVVNQAARVMATAHGGQTVLTDSVRDAAGVVTRDLGTHTLRDIEVPVHLSQLGDTEFPPLWSVGAGIVSLPSPRTSLVGREPAIDEIRRLVAAHRLVTLTGVGGCGKTRLAIEVAYREVPFHPEGVWFVDLSTIADDVALPGVFASALSVAISPGTEATEQIAAYLAPREALLVVDNCEHVIDGAAGLIDVLLETAPRLRVIATSRESLEIEGEFTWKVPSLATGSHAAAVELFVERARAAGATLPDNTRSSADIGEVVEHLDGIPLAIELAAARARSMSVTEIRDLLDDRFRLLSGGSRRSRQRQATLEGTVQWSYDLLSDAEQSMLQNLSVFAGGFSVGDVAAVAQVPEHQARDLVDALAAKSLVDVTRDSVGHVRHRLLETIRLFALARLVDAGGAEAARDRHLDHFSLHGTRMSLADWWELDQVIRIGREYENFRSAIIWALERDRTGAAVRLAAMGGEAACSRGEGQLAIDVLRRMVDLAPADRGFALGSLGWVLVSLGDIEGAMVAVRDAHEVARDHPGDYMILVLIVESLVVQIFGDIRRSGDLFYEARDLATGEGVANLVAGVDLFLALWLMAPMQFDDAVRVARTALASAPEFGYRHVIETSLAWSLLVSGRLDEAVDVVKAFTPVPPGSQWAHNNTIITHLVMGHTDGPEDAARSLAPAAREAILRRPKIISDFLVAFAYLAYLAGDLDRVEEITSVTLPFGAGPTYNYLLQQLAGATAENGIEVLEGFKAAHPALELYVLEAEHAPRLFAEELERWS